MWVWSTAQTDCAMGLLRLIQPPPKTTTTQKRVTHTHTKSTVATMIAPLSYLGRTPRCVCSWESQQCRTPAACTHNINTIIINFNFNCDCNCNLKRNPNRSCLLVCQLLLPLPLLLLLLLLQSPLLPRTWRAF